MNLNLLLRSLKERWISASIFALSLALYVWVILALIPVFIKNQQFKALLAQYPKALMSLFAGAGNINMFSPEGFISIEFLQLWMPIIVFGFAVTFATAIVAKEMDDGTMDLLMAQPIARTSLVLSRFTAMAAYLAALALVTVGSIGVGGRFYDVTFKVEGLLATGLLFLAFMLAIAAFSIFLSVVLRDRGQAIILAVAVFIVSHLLNALSELNETVRKFRFLSIFKYYNPYKALATGEIPWRDISIFLAITLVFLIASLILFRRKDISTV